MRSQSGFTLLELLFTVFLAAILVTIAIPSFRNMILDNDITTTANALVIGLKVARSDAIREGRDVNVCPGSSTACNGTGSWTTAWSVWASRNGTPTKIRSNGPSPTSIVVYQTTYQNTAGTGSTSGTAVGYLPNGTINTAVTPTAPFTLWVCDTQRQNEKGVEIDVSATGSVHSWVNTCT